MKNVIASILLILALVQSFYLYRSGERYQNSMMQEPMTEPSLQSEEEEAAETEETEKPDDEVVPEAGEEKASEDPEAPEKEEDTEQEEQEKKIPSRAEDLNKLQETLSGRISGLNGEWSLYVTWLPTGEGCGIDSRPMTAASLIKLYIAGAYLEAVEQGTMEDLYDASLKNMISQSDNDAANKLIILLGMDYINSFIEAHGFEDTRLNRLMLADNGLENYTSTGDCADLLDQVYAGTFVNKKASERILSAMKEQSVRTKIPAGLPENVESANKTGELSNVQNDAAIVFAPGGDYIFCVMSENVSPGTGRDEIVEMSRIIFDSLGKAGKTEEKKKESQED